MRKRMHIFDIDDCVMDSIFPDKFFDGEVGKGELVEKALKKGYSASLYPEFITYYKKKCLKDLVIFNTGRQRSYLGRLTEAHLSEVCYEKIIYYPEDALDSAGYYISWKVKAILDLLKEYASSVDEFIVYDDITEYYAVLASKIAELGIRCELRPIGGPRDWIRLID